MMSSTRTIWLKMSTLRMLEGTLEAPLSDEAQSLSFRVIGCICM